MGEWALWMLIGALFALAVVCAGYLYATRPTAPFKGRSL